MVSYCHSDPDQKKKHASLCIHHYLVTIGEAGIFQFWNAGILANIERGHFKNSYTRRYSVIIWRGHQQHNTWWFVEPPRRVCVFKNLADVARTNRYGCCYSSTCFCLFAIDGERYVFLKIITLHCTCLNINCCLGLSFGDILASHLFCVA